MIKKKFCWLPYQNFPAVLQLFYLIYNIYILNHWFLVILVNKETHILSKPIAKKIWTLPASLPNMQLSTKNLPFIIVKDVQNWK